MPKLAKVREDYEFDLDVEIECWFEGVYSPENIAQARKDWEIAWCWEYQPDDYDWTGGHDVGRECEEMWEDYEAVVLFD